MLFYDLGTLAHKAADDFAAAVRQRITDAEAAEARRAQAAQEEAERRARAIAAATPAAPASTPVPAPAPAPTPAARATATPEAATLTLGKLCLRLGFTVNAAFVAELGITPAETAGAAKLYRESDFQALCTALVAHIHRSAARDWRAAA
jgi:hypothetical protein